MQIHPVIRSMNKIRIYLEIEQHIYFAHHMKETETYESDPCDCLRLAYINGGSMHYRAGDALGPRLLTDYELVQILEGEVLYTANGQSYPLSSGDMVLGKPGTKETYQWDREKSSYHTYIHFSIHTVPKNWPSPEEWPTTFSDPDPALRLLFKHLLLHLDEHPDWPISTPERSESCMVETMIDILLGAHLSSEASHPHTIPAPVEIALKFIKLGLEEIPMKKFSLDELASKACVTKKHLCRLFSTSLGHSPMQTYSLLRLQFSLVLLSRSNLNINEIGFRCGYDNALYFSRSFKKAFGKPPSLMRKELLAGATPPPSPLPPDLMPRMYW